MEKVLIPAAFALAAAYLIRLIKPQAPHFALAASLCAGVMLLLYCFADFTALFEHVSAWAQTAQLRAEWLRSLLKILVIALVGQWGSRFCRDAGEEGLAEHLETAVKAAVLILCVPYIDQIFSLAVKLS